MVKTEKTAEALQELQTFSKWYFGDHGPQTDHGRLLYASLTRDILSADEEELDRITKEMKLRSSRAMMKKISKNA